jgi:hypothetical protein
MVRMDGGELRTVHSLFTPIALAEPGAQTLVNKVLDWLIAGFVPVSPVLSGD